MKWGPDLAYAVGLFTADGCIQSDGRHLDFTSKDKDQVQTFRRILKLGNRISFKFSSTGNERKYFRIQFGNKEIYSFFLEIGLMPRKSRRLGPLKIPNCYFADFLRGYLDGDGYTNSYWDPRWRSSFMLYLGFASASPVYIRWLRDKIKEIYKITGVIEDGSKPTYQLRFAKKSSLLLIKKMYYHPEVSCLRRKKIKIQKSLDIIKRQAEVS